MLLGALATAIAGPLFHWPRGIGKCCNEWPSAKYHQHSNRCCCLGWRCRRFNLTMGRRQQKAAYYAGNSITLLLTLGHCLPCTQFLTPLLRLLVHLNSVFIRSDLYPDYLNRLFWFFRSAADTSSVRMEIQDMPCCAIFPVL